MITLPDNISNSSWFTPQHLQLLSGVEVMPVINPVFYDDKLKNIFQYYSLSPDEMEAELHRYAARLLDQHKVNEAWQVLLSDNFM